MARSGAITKKMTGTNPRPNPMYTGKPSVPGKTALQYGTGLVKDNTNYDVRATGLNAGSLQTNVPKTTTRSASRLQNSGGVAEKGSPKYKQLVGYKTPISRPKNTNQKGLTNQFPDIKRGAGRPVSNSQKGQ